MGARRRSERRPDSHPSTEYCLLARNTRNPSSVSRSAATAPKSGPVEPDGSRTQKTMYTEYSELARPLTTPKRIRAAAIAYSFRTLFEAEWLSSGSGLPTPKETRQSYSGWRPMFSDFEAGMGGIEPPMLVGYIRVPRPKSRRVQVAR